MRPVFLRLLLALALLALPAALVGCSDDVALDRGAVGGGQAEYDNEFEPPAAPGGDDDDDDLASDDDDDGSDPTTEPTGVEWVVPEPGSTEHHYRAPVQVAFSAYGASAEVRVINPDGVVLAADRDWNDDWTVLTLWPHEVDEYGAPTGGWLLPAREYRVEIEVGAVLQTYAFRTSVVGLPLDEPSAVVGSTFAVGLGALEWAQPAGLEALLSEVDPSVQWLWNFDAEGDRFETEGLLDVDAGLAYETSGEVQQDLCTTTQLLGAGAASVTMEPGTGYFASTPGLLAVQIDELVLTLEDGWIDGDFLPDGSGLSRVGLRGALRVDDLVPWIGDDACDWVQAQLGAACEPCPSYDGQCVPVELGGLQGGQTATGFEDVDADAAGDCAEEPISVLGCSASGRAGFGLLGIMLLPLVRRRR